MLGEGRGGEMVDALALGASGGNSMEVQVLSPAPKQRRLLLFRGSRDQNDILVALLTK